MAHKEFEMSEADLAELLEACKTTPLMYLPGGIPMFNTPQENANAAWKKLGEKMGFEYTSVAPSDKGQRFFYADTIPASIPTGSKEG